MGMQVGGPEEGVKTEPNVVPMIDIMLVLLIIFMIVTPVLAEGFVADMPMSRIVESRPDEDFDIILGIDRDGVYYLDQGTGEIGVVPRERLGEYLTQLFENRTRDKILYFRADRNLPFGTIQEAVEVARASGVRVLATITDEIRDEAEHGLFGGGR
jgi:biopolymer transport protein TolR